MNWEYPPCHGTSVQILLQCKSTADQNSAKKQNLEFYHFSRPYGGRFPKARALRLQTLHGTVA